MSPDRLLSKPARDASRPDVRSLGRHAAAPCIRAPGTPGALDAPSPASAARGGGIVIVDDERVVLETLRVHLEAAGFGALTLLEDPGLVMERLRAAPPDLLLTDVRMPGISGFDLLQAVRADRQLAHLPVIVLTSASDAATRLRALELGASDYLSKPVDPSELTLRLRNHLTAKAYQDELAAARRQSDRLLRSLLPSAVAERLKCGDAVADRFDDATVLFADLVDFTDFAARSDVGTVVSQLNLVFDAFDEVVRRHGLEKIKTIGDSYMLAGGVPTPRAGHAAAVVRAGLDMLTACEDLRARGAADFRLRIGIHSGPVLAGVIGRSKFAYDLWGDTVNVASRMQSLGLVDCIQISDGTRCAIGQGFRLESRGCIDVKGKGPMNTWIVHGLAS